MKIRDASPSDAPSLAAISMEVWIGTYLRHGVSAFFAQYALREFTIEKFETILRSTSDTVLVSENEDGIDGFIRVSFDSTDPVSGRAKTEIKTLYVQPRHHGKGIGKGLLLRSLEICRARAIDVAWLSVNSENISALDFYTANGFVNVGQTHFRIREQTFLNEVMQGQIA